MKILDTISETEKVSMYEGSSVGFFKTLFESGDDFFSLTPNLCLNYYVSNSGSKLISPAFKRLIDAQNNNVISSYNDVLGRMIRTQFLDKWNRVFQILVEEQYNALQNKDYTEHKSADNTDTKTYNTSVVDDGNTGTHEVVTRDSNDNNNVYGVNSVVAVNDSEVVSTEEETVVGDKDKNTSHNESIKTGTDTVNYGVDEDKHISGRSVGGAELIREELDLRNSTTFMNIIFRDIDSVATLQIY